ncbi:MAG: restriction endonuclease [Bacteroidales bacterium]|nr:restriction endonuclease [Bacteroidales bacterium]
MMENEGYRLPRNRWNLWRFVNEMEEGDIVIVPMPYSFSVCRIADNIVISNETIDSSLLEDCDGEPVTRKEDGYLYNKSDEIVDLGFYRKVDIIARDIPRDKYADQALSSRMKIRQTNANIDDLDGSVNDAISAFRDQKPINLKETLMESAAPLVLEKIRTLQNDTKFEALVEWYMKSLGARVDTPWKGESPTEEGDADRIAYFDNIGFAIMIQIKKHSGITDDWAVTQIKGYAANHNFGEYATALWVISSGDGFSEEAQRLAEETGVRLVDGLQFSRMILEAGLEGMAL